MRKLLYIIPLFIFAFTFTGDPSSWTQLTLPVNRVVSDIFFVDSLNGWTVTDWGPNFDTGFVIHSSDGGQNWDIQYNANAGFKNVYFFNKDTGYACANNGHGIIYKTTNGGIIWDTLSYIHLFALDGMNFLDPNTGWVFSDNGISGGVLKTTNAGINWIQQVSGLFVKKVYFTTPDTGWFIDGQLPGHLYKSTNGGGNWVTQYTAPDDLRNIYFLNSQTGFVIGPFGGHSLKKTTNGGINWVSTTGSQGGTGIWFSTQNTGWICGTAGLFQKSTDGGLNWFRIGLPTLAGYNSINFSDPLHGWLAGGKVFKTTDGGITSVNFTGTEIPGDFELYQNYPNPFNPKTTINYELRIKSFVELSVFDIYGRFIQQLVRQEQSTGIYEYTFDAGSLPSGVYFCRLTANGVSIDTKKMLLVK